jgi:hypothetical protein
VAAEVVGEEEAMKAVLAEVAPGTTMTSQPL